MRLSETVSLGTRSSNPPSSSGESANRRSLARSGSLQSTLPAQASSWGSLSALRLVHSAGVARIALLIGRVRRLPRSSCHGGAPAERQDDEERGKRSPPVHQFSVRHLSITFRLRFTSAYPT
jgi:hypothetical protein